MQLEQLLLHISYESVQGSPIQEITDICYHSGNVRCGSLFVCLRGYRTDGHQYMSEAIENGAVAAVIEEDITVAVASGVTYIKVRDTRLALAQLSAAFFDFPANKLKMVGITGTKGKTTTAWLAAQVLREAGYQVGVIGTIAICDGVEEIPAEHTTPEAYEIHKYLAKMVENGCTCCIMEVSSQGIKMSRVAGIVYDIGVFLNIGQDHIGEGEHADFEEYLACKSQLLRQCNIGIVNQDEPWLAQILKGHTCKICTFSMRDMADYRAENVHFFMKNGKLYSAFDFCKCGGRVPLTIQLPGRFNISNALAVGAIAEYFFVLPRMLQSGLANAYVPGRCENVSPTEEYVLLIDYAHNEMSLENLLEILREFEPERLVVMFGCGGNRSKLRRGRMGEVAGRLADMTILTSDNPRWENPEAILDDIEAGIRETDGTYVRISDRREAILYALRYAEKGDILVIAGKGHEPYQEICGIKYPMDDRILVREAWETLQVEMQDNA